MKDSKQTAKLLRVFAGFIETLSSEDADALVNGSARIALEGKKDSRSDKSLPQTKRRADERAVLIGLQACQSREEGIRFLAAEELSRRDLEAVARSMAVPVSKQDRVESLREKIVENVIGARLASAAVRGE